VQIASPLPLNKNNLTGKPLNQWKLGALKSPIKEHCDFGIKVLLEYTKMFRNYVGGGDSD
jgi:hypothetical protein